MGRRYEGRDLRPSLAAVPGSLLLVGSTPYSARDLFYEACDRHHGRDDSHILMGRASTRLLNAAIQQRLIDRSSEDDPSATAAEWCAEFRSDLESLFTREALAAVVVRGRFECAPTPGLAYVGFIDAAGGPGTDSMTLGIAHRDVRGRPSLNLVREIRPPFSPEAVCLQFAHELKRYGVATTFSDRHAAEWPVEQFSKHGVVVTASELTRSELYLELVAPVNSGGVELLDDKRLLGQFGDLGRRTGATGRDSVDHRRGQHDDAANAAAGALVMATQAIGLRGQLPPDFTQCNNSEASAATNCPLLYRGGAHFPSDPHCRKHCAGFKAAVPLYRRHVDMAVAAGEPPMTASRFVREFFAANPFMLRILVSQPWDGSEAIGSPNDFKSLKPSIC